MGIRSFLRRWLGIETPQTPGNTPGKTKVGRTYQQPLMVRLPFEADLSSTGKRAHTSKPKTVAGFYDKAGGYIVFSKLEQLGNADLWLRINNDTNSRTGRRQYRLECLQTDGRTPITKIFTTVQEASKFKHNLLAHHERMKAKAAKSGLNYN